jgi:copper chaperone CopZ
LNKAIGNFEGVATANSNIAPARSMYEGGVNHEELIEAYKEVYKVDQRKANRGEGTRVLLTKFQVAGHKQASSWYSSQHHQER